MRVPDFFILGAARSGTTSLASYLAGHPDVLLSTPKEPRFFEAEYARGLDYYWNTYFAAWRGESAAGEARVANLFLPYVPQRIHESAPDAKLIVILREPGQRAYSHWWFRRCSGTEARPFERAVAEEEERLAAGIRFPGEDGEERWRSYLASKRGDPGTSIYLEYGYYAEQLGRYLELFDHRRLKVFLLDDLRRDPEVVVRQGWEFLGVDPAAAAPRFAAHNASVPAPALGPLRLARSLGLVRRLPAGVRRRGRALLNRFGRVPTMDPQSRRRVSRHYRPHVAALQELLERDLGAWLAEGSGSPSRENGAPGTG
jgi:hypothetical protein